MPQRGKILRSFREAWGWTTRQVAEKSRKLAEIWGDSEYALDASYISKIENGGTPIPAVSSGKLASMMEVYSKGSNTLWNLVKPPRNGFLVDDPLGGPEFTQMIREGRLAEKLAVLMASAYPESSIPNQTSISPMRDNDGRSRMHPFQDRKRYIRAIVGLTDYCLFPLICPGTLLIVDRQCKSIPSYDFFSELERPKFLIETHDGMFCCWCDSLEGGQMIRVVQHPLGTLPHRSLHRPLKLGREAEIIGEVTFWGMESPKHRQVRDI
ncbi:MAG: hypothetical protein BGO25_03450 [Acidobacteriales bacterium 59-55]|nr:helix-turn-helix domain-containing protein [Terriglobales bacterium]OJV40215.1 MAG: hypothetical protein BGO25_03450 [Acidobacteriales bacterium 59-55]